AGDYAPLGAVPVLGQGLMGGPIAVVTHGPYVVGRHSSDPVEEVVAQPLVRGGHDAPEPPIPMHDQCLVDSAAVHVRANCPDVGRRDDCYPVELVLVLAHVGAGYDAPGSAVPVLDQGLLYLAVRPVTDGPRIVRSEGCDCVQGVAARPLVGAGDHRPYAAIPVLGQRLQRTGDTRGLADHPSIVGPRGCGTKEEVVAGAGVGAADQAPTGAGRGGGSSAGVGTRFCGISRFLLTRPRGDPVFRP